MVICIKQHLANILSPIHENFKHHRGCIEKSVTYKKKRVADKIRLIKGTLMQMIWKYHFMFAFI